jgi:tricorn protease
VLIGNVHDGSLVTVDRSDARHTDELAWSSDGLWLAYTFHTGARHNAIKLHDVAARRSVLVTQPEFRDYSPSFDPAGRFLYFLSLRTFDPVYDSVQFEMSFPRAARPYLIALQAGGRPPFEREPNGLGAPDTPTPTPTPPDSAPAALRVDLDGIAARVAPFPVAENRFGKLAAAANGKVLWTVLPIEGAHGRGGHKEARGRLEVF